MKSNGQLLEPAQSELFLVGDRSIGFPFLQIGYLPVQPFFDLLPSLFAFFRGELWGAGRLFTRPGLAFASRSGSWAFIRQLAHGSRTAEEESQTCPQDKL